MNAESELMERETTDEADLGGRFGGHLEALEAILEAFGGVPVGRLEGLGCRPEGPWTL